LREVLDEVLRMPLFDPIATFPQANDREDRRDPCRRASPSSIAAGWPRRASGLHVWLARRIVMALDLQDIRIQIGDIELEGLPGATHLLARRKEAS
jgi:hypothetical protein